ncbi:MAG: DUF1598 domain-containing protein [Pirellulaceae bacterium]
MRVPRLHCALMAIAVIAIITAIGFPGLNITQAQDSGTSPTLPDANAFGDRGLDTPAVLPGGAAMADFGTLIDLIQNTTDVDTWVLNGGNSDIRPYPAGVYVDPTGQLRRVQTVSNRELRPTLARAAAAHLAHPWRRPSPMRTVSLKALSESIMAAQRSGRRQNLELSRLAGLSRVELVQIDVEHEDVLIAGPANQTAFGFRLEDVAVVASLINHQTPPFGCSIEPEDAGLEAASRMLQRSGTLERLAKSPEAVCDELQAAIGPHQIHVFGMNARSATAIALIDADEHMKRVGFGTTATRPRIKSYFDFLDQQATIPEQSLVRWWFAYADEPIQSNEQRNVFRLPDNCIQVLSEQQWVTGQGRAPTGKSDPAADAFAAEMSQHLPELRESHESYARQSSVFETALALQLVLEATGQPSLEAWFPALCAFGRSQNTRTAEPKRVGGLTTWHRTPKGTIVAVVSGGVKVDAASQASDSAWQVSAALEPGRNQAPLQPSSVHAQWWWD